MFLVIDGEDDESISNDASTLAVETTSSGTDGESTTVAISVLGEETSTAVGSTIVPEEVSPETEESPHVSIPMEREETSTAVGSTLAPEVDDESVAETSPLLPDVEDHVAGDDLAPAEVVGEGAEGGVEVPGEC